MLEDNNVNPKIGRLCECCGTHTLHETLQTETFNYKSEKDGMVELSVRVPVWSCERCDESFTDSRAEEIRHEAVCNYLGRFTPRELRETREKYECSQAQWADITGIGIASIKRWESGALIQGLALDLYLRLLRTESIFDELRSIQKNIEQKSYAANDSMKSAVSVNASPSVGAPVFQTAISVDATVRASLFLLRGSHSKAAA